MAAGNLRITGGELKGRRLYVPKTGVRPTTGRVREAIFSMLGDIGGASVLDLYCGSGALGIEALSRGAQEATFVDKRIGAVKRNLEELGIFDGKWGWAMKREDVHDFLEAQGLLGPDIRFDLVFCDPPYRLASGSVTGLDLFIPGVLAKAGAAVVLETSSRNPLEFSFPMTNERAYGDTLIRIYSQRGLPR